MTRTLLVAAVVAAVVLAGCAAWPGGDAATPTPPDAPAHGAQAPTSSDGSPFDGDATGSAGEATADRSTDRDSVADGGRVDFYLSDRPTAIDDFDRLDVTVTGVGFRRAGDGRWYGAGVNATVDLTRLRGANASKVGAFHLPNGTYTDVFVDVAAAEGAVGGADRTVTLPAGQLRLDEGFAVGDGADVDFVFDVAVREAGENGTYVLVPGASESGTGDEVEIRDAGRDPGRGRGSEPAGNRHTTPSGVGDGDGDDDTHDGADDDGDADADPPAEPPDRTRTAASGNLTATFLGTVGSGRNVTARVTWNGTPVEATTVVVTERFDGGRFSSTAYLTDANGTVTAPVSADATAVTASVEYGSHVVGFEWGFDTNASVTPLASAATPSVESLTRNRAAANPRTD